MSINPFPAAGPDPVPEPRSCCDQPMAKVPGRAADRGIGVEHLALCHECGHYEPWD
ncbi:hypothetical protein ACFXHA_43575 [Nocardia sp. NPDC059240]|uniref:hypothetical protein n=1 Tax=Nocardia sp. NPDC059240 TaxID=3346786 RepID=UPI0036C6A869